MQGLHLRSSTKVATPGVTDTPMAGGSGSERHCKLRHRVLHPPRLLSRCRSKLPTPKTHQLPLPSLHAENTFFNLNPAPTGLTLSLTFSYVTLHPPASRKRHLYPTPPPCAPVAISPKAVCCVMPHAPALLPPAPAERRAPKPPRTTPPTPTPGAPRIQTVSGHTPTAAGGG